MPVNDVMRGRRASAEYSPEPASLQAGHDRAVGGFSLLRVAALLVQRYRLVAGVPACVATLVLGITLLQHRTYTSRASFLPQTDGGANMLGNLSGLAAQFGVVVPQSNPAQAPAFFVDLIGSRPILEALVASRYRVRTGGRSDSASLIALYRIRDGTPARQRLSAVKRLRSDLEVSADPKTQVVDFSVRTQWPEVSAQLAARILDLVNDFNLKRRQDQAGAQRAFIDQRLQQSLSEFRSAQDALAAFMARNRAYEGDPELVSQHDRLLQDVSLRQQVYVSLAQSYEQARIEAARDLPVITVVETPEEAPIPDARGGLIKAAAAFFGTFLVLAGVLFAQQKLRADEDSLNDALSLRQAVSAAAADALSIISPRHRRQRQPVA